jgi:hypothetical protein
VRRRDLLPLMAMAPALPARGAAAQEKADGYLWAIDAPGWGIEIDEKLAARFPFLETRDGLNGGWSDVRRLDGTVIKQ